MEKHNEITLCYHLQALVKDGNISLDEAMIIQKKMDLNERKEKLKDYNIWQQKNGSWCVWICDPQKKEGRRMLRKRHLKDLEDAILDILKDQETAETVEDIFNEYYHRQVKNRSISLSTFERYEACFTRHYRESGWDKKVIRDVTPEEWADWLEDEVGTHNLNYKSFGLLKTITGGIVRRAKKKKLISYTMTSISDELDVRVKKRIVDPEKEVFSKEDLQKLLSYLLDPQDVRNLNILLMLLSGIRVGELVTLSFNDFDNNTCFHVGHTETRYKVDGKNHFEIADLPKTEKGIRRVFIPEDYSWIIGKLRTQLPFAHYICTNEEGERMNTECIRKRLYRCCDKAGISRKSPHKGRKTFCSIILDAGFDKNLVESLMGHTDISISERHYHFDRKSEKEKQEKINNLLEFKIS